MNTNLNREELRWVMIGPVIVARIFLTLFGTVLPYCLQHRRREEVKESIMRRKRRVTNITSKISRRLSISKTVTRSTGGDKSLAKILPGASPREERLISKVQALFRASRARKAVLTKRRALENIDDMLEEAGLEPHETFMAYNDLTIQYGMLVFFCSVATWIPFMMLLFNCIECRLRGYQVAFTSRPPLPRKAKDIGPWMKCLRLVSYSGIFLNVCVLVISTDAYEYAYGCSKEDQGWRLETDQLSVLLKVSNWGAGGGFAEDDTRFFSHRTPCIRDSERFHFFVYFIAAGYFLKLIIEALVPRTPVWVDFQSQKQSWYIRKIYNERYGIKELSSDERRQRRSSRRSARRSRKDQGRTTFLLTDES